jgi:hypothetical protein
MEPRDIEPPASEGTALTATETRQCAEIDLTLARMKAGPPVAHRAMDALLDRSRPSSHI